MALVGNPNSGKTTLFNALTGDDQKVGNWAGVTVERKYGACLLAPSVEIVDTPGVYSLNPFTPEEEVTCRFVMSKKADVILNVADSTCLERTLYLTSQLLQTGIPVVVALNMCDEAEAKGIVTEENILAKRFGCAFVPVSALKGEGLERLVSTLIETANRPISPQRVQAPASYSQIELVLKQAQRRLPPKRADLTEKIDAVLLNKWLAFPIFALVMTAVFWISVGSLGKWLTSLIEEKLTPLLQFAVKSLLEGQSIHLAELVSEGVIGGVMSVVSFVPQIMLLFGCIAVLEASGYMARIAFVTDCLLNKLGLSGRSFVCMLLGFGCSVPAVLSTRTVKSGAERETTATLVPFVPCSAKLAVIACFVSEVFNGNWLVAVSFYFVCFFAIICGGLALKLIKKPTPAVFAMELPPYRAPQAGYVLRQMWQRGKAFLIKAGTVIFASSLVLWLCTHLDFRLRWADTEQSILAHLGKLIAPIFVPLGFDDGSHGWQFALATLSGAVAKETVIATLGVLLDDVANAISPLGAYSFVVFNLLTVPCIATVSADFAELGSWKKGVLSALFQILTAYAFSLAIYQTGRLATKYTTAFVCVTCIALLAVAFAFALRHIWRRRHCACEHCVGCQNKKT